MSARYTHQDKLVLLREEGARLDLSVDTVRKAWEVSRRYSRQDIDRLADSVVEHGAVFGPTHLVRLLAVPDNTRRDRLALTAIEERWGVRKVERAVQGANRGRRPGVGRKPAVPMPAAEFLCALDALCDKWERWCARAAAAKAIPDGLSGPVEQVTAAVGKVRRQIARQQADNG